MKKTTSRVLIKKRVARRLAFSYIALSSVLLLLLSFCSYKTYEHRAVESYVKSYQELMRQSGTLASYLLSDVRVQSYRLFNKDSGVQTAIRSQAAMEPQDIVETRNALEAVMQISSLVDSVYLINPYQQTVFTSEVAQYNMMDFYDKYAVEVDISGTSDYFISRAMPLKNGENLNVLSIFFSSYDYAGNFAGGMVVNLDQTAFQNLLASNLTSKGTFIMLDRTGTIVLSNSAAAQANAPFDAALFHQMGEQQNENHFLCDDNGIASLLVFYRMKSMGISFVELIPYQVLVSDARDAQMGILVITFGFMLVGLVLAFGFTRRSYQPLKALLAQVNAKKGAQEDAPELPTAKDEYDYLGKAYDTLLNNDSQLRQNIHALSGSSQKLVLLKMLRGAYTNSAEIQKEIEKSGLSLPGPYHYVIALRIDDYALVREQHSPQDIFTMKYALLNIISELLSPCGKVYGAEDTDDSVVLLLDVADDDINDSVRQAISQALRYEMDLFHISFSTGVGDGVRDILQLPSSFDKAKTAVEYRIVFSKPAVICYAQIAMREQTMSEYPYETEQKLCTAIRYHNERKSSELLAEFCDGMEEIPAEAVQNYFHQLAIAVSRLARNAAGEPVPDTSLARAFGRKIDELTTLEEKCALLTSRIADLTQDYADSSRNQTALTIQAIQEYIAAHYGDSLLNIDEIAEQVKLSPNYVRKLFKDSCQCSLSDYLLNYRISRAKELLKDSDYKVKDIATMVGFSNIKYFYTVFKRETGRTTFEYRNPQKNMQTEE